MTDANDTQSRDVRDQKDKKSELAKFLKMALKFRGMSNSDLRQKMPGRMDRKTPTAWLAGKKWPGDDYQTELSKALRFDKNCFDLLASGASADEVLREAFPHAQPTPRRSPTLSSQDAKSGERSWLEASRETTEALRAIFGGEASQADAARLALGALAAKLNREGRVGLAKAEAWAVVRDTLQGATRHGYVDLLASLEASVVLIENDQGVGFADRGIEDVVCVDWLLSNHTVANYPDWAFYTPNMVRLIFDAQPGRKEVLELLASDQSALLQAGYGAFGSEARDRVFTELAYAAGLAQRAFGAVSYWQRDYSQGLGWTFPHEPQENDVHYRMLIWMQTARFEDPYFEFYRTLIESAENACERQGVPNAAAPELVADLPQSPLTTHWPWAGDVGRKAYRALLDDRSVGPLSTRMWMDMVERLWGTQDESIRPDIAKEEQVDTNLLDALLEEARSLDAPWIVDEVSNARFRILNPRDPIPF